MRYLLLVPLYLVLLISEVRGEEECDEDTRYKFEFCVSHLVEYAEKKGPPETPVRDYRLDYFLLRSNVYLI